MSAAPRLRWAVQERTLGAVEDLDWAMDELAVFRAAAAEGRALDGLIRVYVPEPTVAFGQRDARLPGFEAAAAPTASSRWCAGPADGRRPTTTAAWWWTT